MPGLGATFGCIGDCTEACDALFLVLRRRQKNRTAKPTVMAATPPTTPPTMPPTGVLLPPPSPLANAVADWLTLTSGTEGEVVDKEANEVVDEVSSAGIIVVRTSRASPCPLYLVLICHEPGLTAQFQPLMPLGKSTMPQYGHLRSVLETRFSRGTKGAQIQSMIQNIPLGDVFVSEAARIASCQ